MKTILYYFTGTGNSLAAARMLQDKIPDAVLSPIAGLLLKGDKITAPADTNVGIIYPMYCGGLPNIVVRFMENIDLSLASYVFSVITSGGSSQGSPTKQVAGLCEKACHKLDSAWWVQMPDNYIPLSNPPEKDVQAKIFDAASLKLGAVAASVRKHESVLEGTTFFGGIIFGLAYKTFLKKISGFDKKFTVSPNCNGCFICTKVCPVNNITQEGKSRVSWNHHCEGCLACLQFCPMEAISCGEKTRNRKRYHHPSATVADMVNQKKVECGGHLR